MQQQDFEQSMSKFFDKAGVRIIKKGEGYEDSENMPSYILLDTKRGAYYAAETDIQDNMAVTDNITTFAEDSSLTQNNAYAIYSLSKAACFMDSSFSLNTGDDISALKLKSALVISDENSSQMKTYLENNGYKFQSVPLKNQFLVIFLDESEKKQLVSIYNKYNTVSESDTAVENNTDDDITPVFEPKDDETPENIDLNNSNNNFDAETPIVVPQEDEDELPLITKDDLETKEEPAPDNNIPNSEENSSEENKKEEDEEEELLNNIDLNDLLKPKEAEEVPKDETEAELLYSKFLNEQTEKIEVSNSGPVEKSLDEIPEGLISEDDIKEMTSEDNKKDKKKIALDKKAEKEKAKQEKKAAQLAKKKEQQAKKEQQEFSWLDVPGKVVSNLIGIIFFLPAYILNKLIRRFLPPFVIYWLAAIVAVYGVYQTSFSLIPQPFEQVFEESANHSINLMQTYKVELKEGEKISQIQQSSINMLQNSAIMYHGFIHGVDLAMNKGILLQYLLGFAAAILIIPAFRFIGKTLTIFAILSYFLLPVLTYSQSKMIEYAFMLSEINLTASTVTFLVYIYPVIMFFAVLVLSATLVPDTKKRSEVLP